MEVSNVAQIFELEEKGGEFSIETALINNLNLGEVEEQIEQSVNVKAKEIIFQMSKTIVSKRIFSREFVKVIAQVLKVLKE